TSPDAAKSAAAPAAPVASTSSALPPACSLLTPKDFEEAFGPGAQITHNRDNSCTIEGAKNTDNGVMGVNIQQLDTANWYRTKQAVFAAFPKEKSVSGIGDDAYTYMDGIVFRKGKARVNVTAGAYTGPKPKADVAKYIAEK